MAIPGPLVLPSSPGPQFNSGRHLMDGDAMNKISGAIFAAASTITATAGGGRANAFPINAAKNQISVCATGADSVVLPPSFPGLEVFIQNDGAASCQVFGNGSDTIQGTAGAIGVALANGATALYVCILTGQWKRFVSA